jgi:cytosine/adenosine deaminase-related metal-dependent hydrolase
MPAGTVPGRRWIRGAEVLRSASHAAPERADIWIEDGRIVALTDTEAAPLFGSEAQTIDGSGLLAIPGLVNGHTHSQSALLQGAVPGEPLDLFVIRAMARRAPRSSRAAYVGASLHAMAMLKRGITAHVDHLRDGLLPSAENVEAALEAYRDIGIRAVVAPMYEDRMYLDSLPIDQHALPQEVRSRWRSTRRPPPEHYFALMEHLIKRWHGKHARLGVMLGVDGPQRCTTRLLELTGEFAARYAIGLHTHLLEAKTQYMMAPPEHGGSFARYLDGFGLLNERGSLAHFVWCRQEDVELAAERGVNVVHNPVSNLILGSGIQPAARLLRAGVSVALGTDGQSGAAVSILEQAKFASLLSRVADSNPERWINARSAFGLATDGGARVIGLAGEVGAIEPGQRADLALIDVSGMTWRPRGDVYQHLVMYENGANVRTVMVEGELVVRDGRCVKVDESDLLEEAHAIALEAARANEPWLATVDSETHALKDLLLRALDRPVEANRFADLR